MFPPPNQVPPILRDLIRLLTDPSQTSMLKLAELQICTVMNDVQLASF